MMIARDLRLPFSVKARGAGFLPSVVSEHVSAALVGICAIKSIGYAVLPF